MELKDYVATIEDFPKKGIMFRDVTPMVRDGKAFAYSIEKLAEFAKEVGANVIIGPEARGFIFGCALANKLGLGFAPVRKPGKLPRETVSATYALEYGTDTLAIHKDALKKGDKVLIVDDLLATGGTAHACEELVKMLGAETVGFAAVIELPALGGRDKLECPVYTLLSYDGE
jgi:adenine phosphoribosyltransferase